MDSANPNFASRAVQKTQEWCNQIMAITGRQDSQKAYLCLRAVLHVLRDRLPLEEAVQFGAQLPMLVRGFYYEGWNPARTPVRLRTREEFLEAVRLELANNPEIDVRQAAAAVFSLLEQRITGGELNDVRQNLPEDLRQFWIELIQK